MNTIIDCILTCNQITDKELSSLQQINDILQEYGLSIENVDTKNATGIYISLDQNKLAAKTRRNAGRKHNQDDFETKYTPCTVEELRELLKTTKKTELAEMLKCPRMTLYRVIKNIETRGYFGEKTPDCFTSSSIWEYTR